MSSKAIYELDAKLRDSKGKGASRRLRRIDNRVPAILYGGGEDPTMITLDHQKVLHALEHEGFYSHLLTLKLGSEKQQVILKDIHRHHFKKAVMHMDFFRVKPTDIIQMRVPLHFLGASEAPGVKDSGGIINHHVGEINVKCQAKNLPEFIEVDISNLILDQTLHLSDLKLPKGIESVALSHGKEHDHPVVSIHLARVIIEETPASETEEGVEGELEGEGSEASATTTAASAAKPGASKPAANKAGAKSEPAKDAKKPADKGKKGK